jgi:colanic acid biosynthesis glycosyl transferase WcaI
MRYLLLNQFFVPDTAAAGQLLGDVADALAQRGHDVDVVCSRCAYAGGRVFESYEQRNGVAVHRVGATGFGRRFLVGRVVDYLSFYVRARSKVRQLPRPDVCLALTTPPGIGHIGARLKHTGATKLALWIMDLYPQIAVAYGAVRDGSWIHRRLASRARKLYADADHIISLGNYMTARLQEAGADSRRIITARNWVPGGSGLSTQPTVRDEHHRMTVMYSGNLGLGHELDALVKGVGSMPEEQRPGVVFVGSGKREDDLRKSVVHYGLRDVRFEDSVSLDRLADNLARADVHVVAQRPGTVGLIVPSKIYGVLAAGRPVLFIGPAECEVADIIRAADAGFIVSPGDAAGVARALSTLSVSRATRLAMGAAAREYFDKHLGDEASLKAILECLGALEA